MTGFAEQFPSLLSFPGLPSTGMASDFRPEGTEHQTGKCAGVNPAFSLPPSVLSAELPYDPLGLTRLFTNMMAGLMSNPFRLAQAQMKLSQDFFQLFRYHQLRMLGIQSQPVVAPEKGDKRFRHEAFEKEPFFDFVKQAYLLAAGHVIDLVSGTCAMDGRERRKLDFFTRQFVHAMCPTNFLLTNPEVLEATVKSGGANLVRGYQNLLRDFDPATGQLRVTMTDTAAFKLGEQIATTPGKVVFQNDLIQLLQFAPATDEVKKRPLLVVPPWINKYYILDLRKHNSFVRWAVEQGHTVFVISWVNPDRRHADKGFDSYVEEGLIGAVDAIEAQTGEREVNAVGYCLGGTLLGVGLAYMAAIGDKRIASATFFTSMLDFADPGDLGVFIDENSVSALERKMNERGYLDGSEMASAFSKMRANELIWSFAVNNYMLGRDPVPFDLLFWNADSTRMPARMHSFYLRNMYLHNRLTEPGGIKIMGQPIDLGKIKVPCYFVSALEDHIAPWKSTFSGARLMGGPVRFVLGGSGHIAGIVNPPADNKYCFWLNESKEADADKWLTEAQRHPGSWWTDWAAWVSGLNSETAPARDPEHGVFAPIEDAPGSYASVRLDEGQKR